jgi:holin-like protein
MLEYFTLILVCQLIGEFAVTTLGAPFPGPVVGMVLLFVFLLLNGEVPEQLGNVSNALLNNLSLLFVPAGVGVIVHVNLLGTDLWPLSVAMVASTLLTVAVTALVMVFLNKYTAKNQTEEGEV